MSENPLQTDKDSFKKTRDFQRSCVFLNQIQGRTEACAFSTYLPASYSDRPPLHAVWSRRDQLERNEKMAAGIDPDASPTLKQLLTEKKMMMEEMHSAEIVRKQYTTKHIAIMGKTPDHKGVSDELLSEAKRLTAGRKQ